MGFDGNLNRLNRKLEKKSLDRDFKEFWRDVDRWDHCEKVTFGVPGDRPRVLVFSPCKVVICATFQSLMFFSLENFEKSQEFIERRIDSDHSINFIKVCTRSFVLYLGRGNCLIFYQLGYDTTLKKPIVKDLGRKDFDLYINSFIIFQEMLIFCFKDKENPCLNFYQDTKSLQKPLICLKLKGNKGEIQSILSWHDKIVATTNEGDLFLISFKGFQLKQRCKADDFQIQKISKFLNKIILTEVSEKTKIMIASDSNVIHAWDMNSGRLHGFLIGHHGSVKVFSHCKEGKKVVSADGLFVVIVWDLEKCYQISRIEAHSDSINQIVFTDDNQYFLTCSKDKEIKIFNLDSQKLEANLTGHKKNVLNICFYNNSVFSTSKDRTLIKWILAKEKNLKNHEESSSNIKKIICKKDKILVLKEIEISVYSYSQDTGINHISTNFELLATSELQHLKFSEESNYLTYVKSDDNCIKFLNTKNLETLKNQKNSSNKIHSSEIIILQMLDQGKILYITKSLGVFLCDPCGTILTFRYFSFDSKNLIFFDMLAIKSKTPENSSFLNQKHLKNITKMVFSNEKGGILIISINLESDNILEPEEFLPPENLNNRGIKNLFFIDHQHIVTIFEEDTILRVFSIKSESFEIISELQGHQKEILKSIKTEKDLKSKSKGLFKKSFLVSVSEDFSLKAWTISYSNQKISEISEYFSISEHSEVFTDLIDIPNTSFVATSAYDGKVILYNIPEKRIEHIFYANDLKILGLGIVQSDLLTFNLLSYSKKSFQVWNLEGSQKEVLVKGAQTGLEKFLALYKLKNDKKISSRERFLTFGNQGFTYLHYYFFKDKAILAKKALKIHAAVRLTSNQGKRASPLFYAIKFKNFDCIQVFFEYLQKLAFEHDFQRLKSVCCCIKDEVFDLIRSRPPSLFNFFQDIYLKYTSRSSLNMFGDSKGYLLSKNFSLGPVEVSENHKIMEEHQLIETRTCLMSLPLDFGTARCVHFLKVLKKCNVNEIFKASLIQDIIDFKWNESWKFILIESFFHIILMVTVAFINFDLFKTLNTIIMMLFLVPLGVKEGFLIKKFKFKYFSEFWTWSKMMVVIFNGILGIFILDGWDFEGFFINLLRILVIFFTFLQGFTCLRLFQRTRIYFQVISDSISDAKFFLSIYIYIGLVLMLIFSVLEEDQQPKIHNLLFFKKSLDMTIENLIFYDKNDISFQLFFIICLILVMVALVSIVSILRNTFKNFKLNFKEIDAKEKLSIIIEIESIFSIFKSKGKFQYFKAYCLVKIYDCTHHDKMNEMTLRMDKLIHNFKAKSKRNSENLKNLDRKNSDFMNLILTNISSRGILNHNN